MDLSLSWLADKLFTAAFIYMIVATQLSMGFPPFYRPFILGDAAGGKEAESKERTIRVLAPFMLALAAGVLLWIVTDIVLFQLAAALVAVAGGVMLRHGLYRETGGPLPWTIHPWTVHWPMLVFDRWTLGFACLFGLMTLG
ncbi:MAG: hypothetical protein ACFB13_04195 [Kiloniellaceae bacterium]